MTEQFDIQAAIAQAATQAPNMAEASKGGGGYTPPNKGKCVAILVGYVEIGRHKKVYQGKESFPRYAEFIFELQGGVNPVETTDSGERVAKRITVKVAMPEPGKQPNEKSGYYKLFSTLNYDDSARHPSQLLGKHWLADVQHDVVKKEGKDDVTFASLGYSQDRYYLEKPTVLQGDVLAGNQTEVPIPLPDRVSALRLFLWDFPSKPMWDSLFIDGEYPEKKDEKTGKVIAEAKSKNVIQAKIKAAQDWVGSPMQEILTEGELDLPSTAAPAAAATGGAAADPLAGMV